jgi:hypothetical protein
MYTKEDMWAASDEAAESMVRHNLLHSNEWMLRGLVAIYRRQTADEQTARDTRYQNGKGFNSSDARYMTWAAQCVLKFWSTPPGERRFPTPLNATHTAKVRGKMNKYAGQLVRVVREGQPKERPVLAS